MVNNKSNETTSSIPPTDRHTVNKLMSQRAATNYSNPHKTHMQLL